MDVAKHGSRAEGLLDITWAVVTRRVPTPIGSGPFILAASVGSGTGRHKQWTFFFSRKLLLHENQLDTLINEAINEKIFKN